MSFNGKSFSYFIYLDNAWETEISWVGARKYSFFHQFLEILFIE